MRTAYVDCFSGAAGDMLLGALLDAGLDLEALQGELRKLRLEGYGLSLSPQMRNGIRGTKFDVVLHAADGEEQTHEHRHLADIETMIEASALSTRVKSGSLSTFRRLAVAEAKVHCTSIDEVHFHEVGAVDSIVDIVGFVVGLELLGIGALYSSPLTLGSGTIRTEHGVLPAPAPATMEILTEAGVLVRRHPRAETELLTPTAAALLSELALFSPEGQPQSSPMTLERVGYGFGTREFDWLNAVRIWLGKTSSAQQEEQDEVVLLECNLDDATGETLGYALERCLEAGALDAWFTPIQMKKNRPGVKLSVLAASGRVRALVKLILRETPTLGVRYASYQRGKASRRLRDTSTPWGEIQVKEKILGGEVVGASPEYEDCARIARETGVPLREVYDAAERAARACR